MHRSSETPGSLTRVQPVSNVPYLAGEHPIRFAHRGSRLLWPENTMEAFRGVVGLGCRYIETDVRISNDGHVVAFHDAKRRRQFDSLPRTA